MIQGAPVQEAGPPAMGAPYTAAIAAGVATVYVPAYSAVLVQSTLGKAAPSPTTLSVRAPSITYGSSATISVNVTADSGTPTGDVTLTVDAGTALSAPLASGTASFTASALAAGTHQLSASYAAQGNYAAGTASGTLMVAQAPLTVTATDASRAYGAPNPAFAYTIAGFVNGDSGSVVTGAPVESSAATVSSAAGAYPITVTQGTLAAANYSFALANGSLTVTQASSTVALTATTSQTSSGTTATLTANVSTQYSGTASGTVTFLDGGTSIGTAQLANGAVKFTTGTLSPGSHSLTAVYAGDTNFTGATSNAVAEQIVQATVTINWTTPAAITYGTQLNSTQLDAAATAQVTNVPGTFSYTPAAGTVLGVGSQTLKVTFTPTDSADYTVASGQVTILVNPAVLTVAAANASRVYGAANPAFTYTITGLVNGDSSAVISGQATESTGATASSAAGAYPITVTQGTLAAANYSFSFANATLTVNKATSSAALTGTLAGNSAQLTATVTPQVSGVPSGTVSFMDGATALGSAPLVNGVATLNTGALPGGSNSLTAVYGGDANFVGATSNTLVEIVSKTTPTISWSAPAAISYGTALSGAQLDATSSVQGSFAYTPAAGTVLGVGPHTLTATFTPTDTSQYNAATASVSLTVVKATPSILWPGPAAIIYGTPLSSVQLNASSPVAGAFTYSPVAGTLLSVGPHTLVVRFVPADGTDYNRATTSVTITVSKATPQITWANPAPITYGTRLSSKQLNAKANVAGRFAVTHPLPERF